MRTIFTLLSLALFSACTEPTPVQPAPVDTAPVAEEAAQAEDSWNLGYMAAVANPYAT